MSTVSKVVTTIVDTVTLESWLTDSAGAQVLRGKI
jgi:hypothetical protein